MKMVDGVNDVKAGDEFEVMPAMLEIEWILHLQVHANKHGEASRFDGWTDVIPVGIEL